MDSKLNFNNENFDEMFKSSVSNVKIFEEQMLKGRIVRIEKDNIIIDVGLKSEGLVNINEFKDENGEVPELKVGELVDVFVESYEDKSGLIVLSREKAQRENNWYKLEKLCEEGTLIEGFISKRVKGGFAANVMGSLAFLPGSQLDVRPIKNINALVGTTQSLKILTMDRKRYNIVVSRKAVIEKSLKDEAHKLNKEFKEGDVVEGIVKNITGYGVFIELGFQDGLLHVTDISWSRINHPSEVLQVGQKVKVKIIKIHPETGRISLGIKQLSEDPWVNIDKEYESGKLFKVLVTNITDYGIFVQLKQGVEGLIHISEISWDKNIRNINDFVKMGDTVEAVILDVDVKKRRISLSMKQGTDNPWVDYAKNNAENTIVTGVIKEINKAGIVVGLNNVITGFVKVNDLSWDENLDNILDNYKEGDSIRAKILRNDTEKEKIVLGVKQLDSDPFLDSISKYNKGDVVKAKVVKILDKNLKVELESNVVGLIRKSDISLEKEEQRLENYKEGDEVEAIITNVDQSERVYYLSIKAIDQMDQKKHMGSEKSDFSLGEVLNEALNKKKQ